MFCTASVLAIGAGLAAAPTQAADTLTGAAIARQQALGSYLTGDKHNHTTCVDGSTSVKVLIDQATLTYDLDWFSHSGHGGSGNRDCRVSDPEYDGSLTGEGRFWDEVPGIVFKGTPTPTVLPPGGHRNMWRWQQIQDYNFPAVVEARSRIPKPIWLGLEWNVPGHEHASMAIFDGQFPLAGADANADGLAQFEYLYDRNDNDLIGGAQAGFERPSFNNGKPKVLNVPGNHAKAVDGVAFMRQNFALTSYMLPAHLERAGGYLPTADAGFNVEHLRDFHNAGLLDPNKVDGVSLAFGMESQPGHQAAAGGRGEYNPGRPTACLTTFGGTGCYVGAEASLPGKDFAGNPIDPATIPGVNATVPVARVVLGRPGLHTLWDSMLGEGRRFFTFASSDWHNRGQFSPFEKQSTLDFWPGEYQKIYAFSSAKRTQRAQSILEGMRSGNSWHSMGDLIDELFYVACYSVTRQCATMGQTLNVSASRGGTIQFEVRLRDPAGANLSPYTFANPSLLQINKSVPLNKPVLHHVDVIAGDITGPIAPSDPAYSQNNSNPSTRLLQTFGSSNWVVDGERRILRWSVPVARLQKSAYYRLRGTNLPQGLANETDAQGNPLTDALANNILCTATGAGLPAGTFDPAACPTHLPRNVNGAAFVDMDVEGWSDLWFYSNPIFITRNN